VVRDEMDDFDFLMNESFERKQKLGSGLYSKKGNKLDESLSAVGGMGMS
jgi:hypothetical protein